MENEGFLSDTCISFKKDDEMRREEINYLLVMRT